MSDDITFDGAFPELFGEFVGYKRSLGYLYPESRLYLVRRLSRFLAARTNDERVLTRDAAEAFARRREGESSGSAAGRRGIVRQFALFLQWKGIEAWVLPERSEPRRPNSFAPRIVTADEMARIIACADGRPASRCGPHVPRQVVGRISSLSRLGMVGLARPGCTSIGRFQAIASCGRTVLYSIR